MRVKKISSLPGESPSHSPSTLCLRADLLSTSLHASSLSSAPPLSVSLSHSSPLSADLASDSSLSPVSLPSVLGVTSSQNSQRKPGQMANLDPATLTCPDSRRSPGRRTPFVPPFGEGLLLPQPPQQTSPMVALGGSSTPLLTSPRAGVGGQRKASETVTWPASPESEAREATTALLPVCSAPMIVPPLAVTAQNSLAAAAMVTTQPLAAANVTALGTQWGPSFTSQGSATSWGSQRFSQWFPQPFMGGFPCHTQGQPVVPPAIHGWIPLPHPGTAALASLVAAAVLHAAASHSGPSLLRLFRPGCSFGRGRLLSLPLLGHPWFPPQGLTTQEGPRPRPRALSQRVCTPAGPSAAGVFSGAAGSHSAPT